MRRLILAATLALGLASMVSSAAFANELDNESGVTNKELQGTLVLRVDTRTKETSFVKTAGPLASEKEAKSMTKSAKFSKLPAKKMKSELDQDGGASSWYFYQPYNYGYNNYNYNYYQPYCYYYGNTYQPYYSYNYGYYNYYYYNSWWSYGRY